MSVDDDEIRDSIKDEDVYEDKTKLVLVFPSKL